MTQERSGPASTIYNTLAAASRSARVIEDCKKLAREMGEARLAQLKADPSLRILPPIEIQFLDHNGQVVGEEQ